MDKYLDFVERAEAYLAFALTNAGRRFMSFLSWISMLSMAVIALFDLDHESITSTGNPIIDASIFMYFLIVIGTLLSVVIVIVDICRVIRFFLLKARPKTKPDLSLNRYIGCRVRMTPVFKRQYNMTYEAYLGKVLQIKTIDKSGSCTILVDGKDKGAVKYQLHTDLILVT